MRYLVRAKRVGGREIEGDQDWAVSLCVTEEGAKEAVREFKRELRAHVRECEDAKREAEGGGPTCDVMLNYGIPERLRQGRPNVRDVLWSASDIVFYYEPVSGF